MKACVIGGGPAGLFSCKYLLKNNIPVKLFEKTNKLLGNYNFATEKTANFDFIKNVDIEFNKKDNNYSKEDCDFFIVATGGIPRKLDIPGQEYAVPALDVLSNKKEVKGDLCIIGMGNVTMDLLNYINSDNITVFSKSNLENAPFDNYKLRELKNVNLKYENNNKSGKFLRRENILSKLTDGVRNILLKFNTTPKSITRVDNKLKFNYKDLEGYKSQLFDNIISSIGFIPNDIKIDTKKEVYKIGWCKNAKGSIGDTMMDSQLLVSQILNK